MLIQVNEMKCEDREEMRLIQNCPYEGKIEVGMDDGPSSIIVGRMSVCRVRVLSGITSRFSILYSIVRCDAYLVVCGGAY